MRVGDLLPSLLHVGILSCPYTLQTPCLPPAPLTPIPSASSIQTAPDWIQSHESFNPLNPLVASCDLCPSPTLPATLPPAIDPHPTCRLSPRRCAGTSLSSEARRGDSTAGPTVPGGHAHPTATNPEKGSSGLHRIFSTGGPDFYSLLSFWRPHRPPSLYGPWGFNGGTVNRLC